MARRIFIAIELPHSTRDAVSRLIAEWHWLPIRWLDPLHLHVTLIPPASFTDEECALLVRVMEKARLGGAFPISFSKIVLAPSGERARMIWLEGNTPPELEKLTNRLVKAWSGEPKLPSLPTMHRPLQLHVTLARFPAGDLAELESKTRVLGETLLCGEVQEVSIMESHLTRTGARYERVASVALQK